MLRLLVAAALLGAGQPRLVYEPEADFYGADEITVEVTTDADADNASTVIPIVVAPTDDAATLVVSGNATAEAGGAQICVLANATINDVDGGDSIVSLVVRADRGSIALKPTAHDAHGVRLVSNEPLTLEATPLRLTALLRTCGITYEPPRTPGPDLVTASVDGGPPSSLDIDVAPAAPPVLLGCGSAPIVVQEGASTSIPLVFSGGVDDFPVMKLAWSSPSVVSILNGTDSLLSVATPTSIVLSSPASLRRMVASQLLVYKAANRGTHAIRFELTGLRELNGTTISTSEATCSIRVSPTNAVPSFLGDMFWKGDEDALISVRGVVVTDSDGDDLLLDLRARTGRLLLAAKPVGIHIATSEKSGVWPANSTSLVLRGGVDALNRALDGLRFEPPRDFSGEASIDMRVVDEAGASDEKTAIIDIEEVADAPQFLDGEAISARDGAVHAREDEVMRLGGSSHGWPATGGHGEVVSLAPNDLGSNDAVLSISIDHFTAFLLRNDTWLEHGVAVLQSDELRLSGTVQSLSAALADVTLIPSQDWHGPARLRLNLTENNEELASTTIEIDIEGVQDAPVLIDEVGSYEVDEDTYLPLAISLEDPDYDHGENPEITCSLRVSARSGSLRIVGGKAFAASSGAILFENDGIELKGTPSSITSTLTKLEYTSAPDWSGDDVVDVVADDGGGFPVSDALIATLALPIRVHAVADAPRVTSPSQVLFDEASKGVALGRNGTKTETPVPGVSVYDPDSDVVSVTLTATSGRVKVVGRVQDVESSDGTESPSSYQRTLTLRANQSALNAALSTLTWVPDDQIAGRDGYISGSLKVEASDGVLTNATSISIRAAASNDPPRITGAVEDVLMKEDSDWLTLPPLDASDADDRALTLQVSARSEGALEVHAIKTSAPITTRSTAVHVVRVVNASWNASQVERGAFRLVVDLSHVEGLPEGAATRATTEPIAFDAVARIDDERTGSAGERLRERDGLNPDLSHQSVQAKIESLPNVKRAGLRVTVSREDYAAFGSQHYDRYDSLGGARYVDDYEVRRSYYKSVGSRYSRPAPLQSGHEWRITFEGSTPEAASSPLSIHADESIWDGLRPSVETVRHANSIHGSFSVSVKGYSTSVRHNASSTDLERALSSLPSVTAVLVSRSGEDQSGGFEWLCTFMESSVDLRVDGSSLRGEHATVTSSLLRARFGDPQLHRIDVSHDPHVSIHALSLKRGRNFVRIGLDTRNCSIYSGGSHYLAQGSLRFTRPIPRIAPGSVEEEVDGMAEFNRGLDHAYPPHSLPGPNSSVEAHLLSLPNWADLGDEASVQVSKHDNAGTTVWRVTFVNTPHALPLLRVVAVEGNDNRNLDVLALIDPEEDIWMESNTSITRSRSYASRAGLKSRSSSEASAALEREASQLQGTWRLRWGSDETWSRPLSTDVSSSELQAALASLPALRMPHPARKALIVVSRARVPQGGFVYYIAFERDAYDSGDLHADPSQLRGPPTKRCRVTRLRDSTNAGKVRINSVASLSRIEGDPHSGSTSFRVVGAPHSINDVLQTWSFQPARNYYGRVVVDAAVIDGRNATAYHGLSIEVENRNDAPSVSFRGDGALAVDEDAEARMTGITVSDVDAEPGEVHTLTIEANHGVVAVHQTATDARFGGEASYTETLRRGGVSEANRGPSTNPGVMKRMRVNTQRIHPEAASSVNGSLIIQGSLSTINQALATLSYISDQDWHGVDTVSITAVDASNASTSAELLVRVRPVNDVPAWHVDSLQRDADAAQHPSHASSAGRGTSLLYGRYDHLSDAHDASSYYRRNNATVNPGVCVPVVYESATDAPVAYGTCMEKWSSPEDDCVDEEGCSSCDGDDEAWCMLDQERWCYCSTQVDAVVVPSRYFEEDQGCVLIGGLSIHDADVRFVYGRDFSSEVPWPAHLEISAEVDDGVLALRSGAQRGAAAVLEHAFEGDSFENLEVVAGDASHGSSTLVMRGTLGAINLALEGLCYSPNENWNGVDVLRLTATDGGDAAHGSGGIKTSEVRVALHVRGVRDAPVVTAPLMDVEALEDAVIQFGGEKTSEIYVSSSFSIVDGDLADLTKPLRRWLVPSSESLDSVTTKTWTGPWREANRFDSDSTDGTFAYVDANHPTWLGSIEPHGDAGQLSSLKHAFTRTQAKDSYSLHISSRRGGLRLPLSKDDDKTWPHSIVLRNYTLFETNRALQNLLYKPDLHWNSQHAAQTLADVGTAGGVIDHDIALENITVVIEDATGFSGTASLLFFLHPVNDAPVLQQQNEVTHLENASSDQLTRLRLSTSTILVAEDSTIDAIGLNVRDVDCGDVAHGAMDVSAVVHRGTLSVDATDATVTGAGDMLHIHGSPVDVSNALGSLAYTPSKDYAGDDALFVTASDRGNVGRGGAQQTSLEVPLFVDSSCDAPVIQPIQKVVAADEDDGVSIGFEVSDADHANLKELHRLNKFREYLYTDEDGYTLNTSATRTAATFFPEVQVMLTAGNGTLTLDSSIRSALTFVQGRGVSEATMTFRATLAHAQTALSHVSYEPSRDYFTLPITDVAADTVTLEVNDLGKDFGGLPEGLGQRCDSLKTTGSIRIQINAINDEPHVAVPGSVYRGLPGGTSGNSLRRDLELVRVKPLTVDEDAILELGHLINVDDDGDDPRAFPAAEGALTVSVERGTFWIECNGEALDVGDAPFGTSPQSTSEGWRTGSMRLRLTPEDRDTCLKTLRFRGLKDDHSSNSSITIGYEDGGYGSIHEAAGVRGCRACAPAYGSAKVEPSLFDVKTIPIIILPKADPPSIASPYDDGVSVVVDEDHDLYLPHVQVVDPDDAEASYVLRASTTHGAISLGVDAWFQSPLRYEVGDGDADKSIVARGPLSAVNAALAGLLYKPPRDFTATDEIDLLVEDVSNYGRTASLSIPLRVAPSVTWNDAPVLRIPNETRVGTPCLAAPQSSLLRTRGVSDKLKEYPQCDRRLAVAAFANFAEDVPRKAFAGISVSDADGSRLKVSLETLRGTLRFDRFDALGLESLVKEPKLLEVRGEPELINEAFSELEYVSDANWYGVDHLNITVHDANNHFDRATILLDVLARADAPFLEMRSDDEESYYRGTTGETRYEEGNWKRVLQFEVQAEEDRRVRLPSLRVRDVDAEANSETLEAAARGLKTAASAIRELVGGVQVPQAFENSKVEQDATLRLDISVEHGKISLCSIRCPGVLFVEAEHDRDASRRTGPATDGDVVRQGWPELVEGGRAESGEILQLLDAAPVRKEDGLRTGTNLKWWRNATLRGTAANLNAALWDMHYWPALNYNSDDGRERDHLSLSIVDEAGSEQAHTVDAAIRIAAINDRPVVRAARLETVSISNKGDVQTTGDGLSLVAIDVNDDALATNEDEPLPLTDLFTVRDVDTDAALEIVITTTHGRSSFSSQVSEVVFVEPTDFVMSRGSSHIKFLATEAKANSLLASLIFTPLRDWHGKASLTVTCNDRGGLSHAQSIRIRVRKANDAPVVTAPELGGGYALYLDQGGRGKLEGASHEEAGRFYRQTMWTAAEAAAYVYDEDVIEYQYPSSLEAHAGYELWRSAPTRDYDTDQKFYDSEPVIGWESAPVHDIKRPRFFVNFQDRLFFAATDEKHGAELWSTDGSITNMNADVMPGRASSDPRYLTKYEDLLYFSAAGHAADEWRIDPKYRDECDSMRRSSFDENIAFVVSASNEWVPGMTYDCPRGWRWMDSAEALRTFTGRNYGPSQGGRDESARKQRHDMATTEERVYYSQCGWDAWEYEGIQREHFRFSDSHETGLYKAASSPDSRRPDVDLIKGGWQGIELKTSRFAGIVCRADPDSYDVAPTGRELWASDGSPQGTFRAVNSASHSDPQYLCVFDGALFFGALSEHGRELHRFSKEDEDGRGVMRLVADVRRGPDGSDPKYLTSCGNVLWFVANDGLRGEELYASDGGLGYLNRDAGDSANNNVLYEQRGESGTRLAKDIRPGKGSSSPAHFVCLNNVLLFAATSDDTGRELWRAAWSDLTDSTTLVVQRVADVHQGSGSSSPEYLAVLHNKVYFSADDGRVGRELWKTDGTPSGTRLVADSRLGSLGSSPRYLTRLDNRLFYVARTPDPADEVDRTIEAPVATRLWATDGTRANTRPVFDTTVMDLDRRSLDEGGGALASLKNALYYPARRGASQLDGGLNGGHASQRKGRPLAFSVHDADDDILTLVLDVLPREAGGLSLDVAPPPSIEVLDGDLTMDETQTFRGTSAHLNLLLADLWFVAAPQYAGAVEIKAEVRDDPLRCVANVTDGCERGENATGVATMRVFVRRQNQAPFVHVIKGPVGASADGWNRFEGFASVGDPDADGADLGLDASTGLRIEPRLVVTVTVQKGVVSLGATDARLSFIEGTGVDDRRVVVDASVEALNEALGVVTYACENCELGSDEITVEVDDGGFSGLGGRLTASASVEVSIVRR